MTTGAGITVAFVLGPARAWPYLLLAIGACGPLYLLLARRG